MIGLRRVRVRGILARSAALIVIMSGSAFAEWHSLDGKPATAAVKAYSLEVLSSDYQSTVVRFRLRGFDSSKVEINGGGYAKLAVPGLQATDDKGLPELPRLNRNIMIPVTSDPSLEIVDVKSRYFDLGTVAPSKGPIMRTHDPESVPYVFSSFYQGAGGSYPESFATISKPFQLRDVRGVNLGIRPIRYSAADGRLEVVEELVVRIDTPRTSARFQVFANQGLLDSTFLRVYQNAFLNFDDLAFDRDIQHVIEDTGRLLVIYHPSFEAGLEPFVRWKRQRGLQVHLASLQETGDSVQDIKSYIADKYRSDRISSVILVGDAEFVPFHPGTSGNARNREADPMYGLIEGDDQYPEVMIARFSVKDLGGGWPPT